MVGARHDDLIDVVLDDADGPEGSARGAADGSTPRRRRPPWTPRRRRAVAAVVVALVLGAVAVRWDPAARREARLADVQGLSVSLAVPLRALWQVDGRILGWSRDGQTVLVATDEAIDGVDATTGAPRWHHAGAASWCDLGTSGQAGDAAAASGGGASREVAACTVADGAEIEMLDVASGEVLLTIRPGWPLWSSAVVDGDLVLAGVDQAGRVVVVRWTSAGERVWATLGPVIGGAYQGVRLSADGARLTVEWSAGSMSLDADTGAELPGARDATRDPVAPRVDASDVDARGDDRYGLATLSVMPSGLVVLAGANRAAVLGR